jgi:hypothetical protein
MNRKKTEARFAVDLVADQIVTKRAALRAIENKLRVTDRQARAAVSSYIAEGWTEPGAGSINSPLCYVSSLDNRLADHADRRYDARRENGRLGGRPKKAT